MKITKVLGGTEPPNRRIKVCDECVGKGWYWSDLEFGDIPGDEDIINCRACDGTGRVTTLTLLVEATVPSNYKIDK